MADEVERRLPGRILAVDHGSVRIGLAWSDPLLIGAHPGEVVVSRGLEQDLGRIQAVCEEREIVLIVVGLPRNMDDSEGAQARSAREFGRKLQTATGLPVVLWDERLSSLEAEEILDARGLSRRTRKGRQKRRAERDAIAASFILSGFLDTHREQLLTDGVESVGGLD